MVLGSCINIVLVYSTWQKDWTATVIGHPSCVQCTLDNDCITIVLISGVPTKHNSVNKVGGGVQPVQGVHTASSQYQHNNINLYIQSPIVARKLSPRSAAGWYLFKML